MLFKDIVKNIREKSKMTQVEFGKLLGVHKLVISQYETGHRQRPAVRIALRLLKVAHDLNISLSMGDLY